MMFFFCFRLPYLISFGPFVSLLATRSRVSLKRPVMLTIHEKYDQSDHACCLFVNLMIDLCVKSLFDTHRLSRSSRSASLSIHTNLTLRKVIEVLTGLHKPKILRVILKSNAVELTLYPGSPDSPLSPLSPRGP